ncbi:hypothetical protein SAMN04515666_11912 [Bosea lupini]|uniref:Uncharacterized protein n=2 Tax=Bosea lupini TaxID=1036779 RepID=A0A1H8ADI1_9HYPH|nr:hypothetical protein SAMN04515666_11912 [Bosea lupini]
MSDEMTGLVVDVDGAADSIAAELCVAEDDPGVVLLVIHSGRDQIRISGLQPAHARLVELAFNAIHED